jgi:GT2 family glycosyltransferase
MSRIAAIVLTYNRVELLKLCLAAIARQATPCDLLIVVDNGSTDGTAEFLARYDGPPRLVVVPIAQNCGPAAGFNKAFHAGLNSGAELLWVMDDDVVPGPDALGELLRGQALLLEHAVEPPFLLSVARSPDGKVTNVPDLDSRVGDRGYSQWPGLLHEGLLPIRRGTFVSALFPRATLLEHGFPLSEMYMWGEDSEYTLRITRKQPGYLVGRSQVDHLRAQAGSLQITTEPDPVRIKLHRIHIRNLVYNARKYMDGVRRRQTLLGVVRLVGSLIAKGRLRHAGIITSGLLSGFVFAPAEAAGSALPPATNDNFKSTQLSRIGGDECESC